MSFKIKTEVVEGKVLDIFGEEKVVYTATFPPHCIPVMKLPDTPLAGYDRIAIVANNPVGGTESPYVVVKDRSRGSGPAQWPNLTVPVIVSPDIASRQKPPEISIESHQRLPLRPYKLRISLESA